MPPLRLTEREHSLVGEHASTTTRDSNWIMALADRDALDVLVSEHCEQSALCDALEQIADGLPDHVDREQCARVAHVLRHELPLHHRGEEHGLFPMLRKRALPGDEVEAVLERLSAEHGTDEGFADEIAEVLEKLARREATEQDPNTLGYMLRGFFEAYRRHIHWENTLLIPLARKRLTRKDLQQLSMQMTHGRRATAFALSSRDKESDS